MEEPVKVAPLRMISVRVDLMLKVSSKVPLRASKALELAYDCLQGL